MKKLALIASIAAGLVSVAQAGMHSTIPVSVYKGTSASSAGGSVQSARYYTSDSNQYIGCSSSSDTVSSTYIACSARDSAGNYLYCYTSSSNSAARDAVAAVNTTSYIYFAVDSAGKCTYITVSNNSAYL
jgi:hypothetical protein